MAAILRVRDANGNVIEIPAIVGAKGDTGASIQNIVFKESNDTGNVYTIHLSDGTSYDFTAPAGKDGSNGSNGKDGTDGSDGKDGADGKTPVKGTDYWTEEDKTEMVNAVLAALPAAEEAKF